MKNHILIALALLTALSCSKQDRDKYSDSLYIRGRAFFTDTISQDAWQLPFKNKKIMISQDVGDTLNYMYTVLTDSQGYFIFNLLSPRKEGIDKYRVSYNDSIHSIYYSGSTIIDGKQNDIILDVKLDSSKQNVLIISATDSAGGALPNATLQLYTSSVLASNNDPTGAVTTMLTNSRGFAYVFNLLPRAYYVTGSMKAGSLTLQRTAKRIDIISKTGEKTDSLQLH